MDFTKPALSRPHLLSCHKIERKGSEKVTYLLLCIFKTQTPIPVLFVNLLMDFDASVPIDQTEPSLTAERTSAHGSSRANI